MRQFRPGIGAPQNPMDNPHSTTMVILSTKEFEEFKKAFDDASADLKWIRSVTGHEYDYLTNDVRRYKRKVNPLEALLASFNVENGYSDYNLPEQVSDMDSGDAWYSNFRSKECKNGDCIQRTFKYAQKAKKRKRGRKAKGFKKFHKYPVAESGPDVDYDEDEIPENLSKDKSNGKADPDYDEYDNMKTAVGKSGKEMEKLRLSEANKLKNRLKFEKKYFQENTNSKRYEQSPNIDQAKEVNYDFMFDNTQQTAQGSSQGEHIELKDQVEKTQNDLSHEADYKLSKIEQEAMEKKSSTREWPLKHPDYQIALLMQQKDHDISKAAPSSVDQKRSITQEGISDGSRNLDPDSEIRLKVSSRLMEKGLSASLPSDSLRPDGNIFESRNSREYNEIGSVEDTKKADGLHNELRRNKRDTWENEDNKSTARKLMTISDYDSIDLNGIDDRGNENKELQGAQNSIANSIKELKTNYNTELQNNNIEIDESNPNDEDGLTVDFSDALLKSADTASNPSCADTSKLLKVGSKLQNSTSENNGTCEYLNSGSVITINKSPKLPNSNCNTSSVSTVSIPNPKSSSNSKPSQVSLKFGVAFNVTLLNGTSKFDNDNTSVEIGVNKKKRKHIEGSNGSKLLMVSKRGIVFPPLPAWLSKQGDKAVSRSIDKSTEDSDLDCLINGQLTAQLVNAVLRLVQGNQDFRKHILPALKNHKVKACTGCNNLNTMKTDENCDEINRSEKMLRQVMDTISAIIEQQVRSRMCIPLCPALKDFYEMIIQSRVENEKKARSTKSRMAAAHLQNHNKIVKREASDEPKIRRKYSIVKKLLNEYSYLPSDEQEKVKDAKDLLQVHLAYLDELERAKKRKKRNIARNIFQPINAITRDTGQEDASPEFVKLVKTAEMMRKITRLHDEVDYSFLQEDDYF